jgi:hypothetical protein
MHAASFWMGGPADTKCFRMVSGKSCPSTSLGTFLICKVHFGRLGFVEFGALTVGRIIQRHPLDQPFQRGAQKSVFKFGGSAIAIFGEPGMSLLQLTGAGAPSGSRPSRLSSSQSAVGIGCLISSAFSRTLAACFAPGMMAATTGWAAQN